MEELSLYLHANVWTRGLNVSLFYETASDVALKVFGNLINTVSQCFAVKHLVSKDVFR